MGKGINNMHVKHEFDMTNFSTRLEETAGDRVTDAKYKRFSLDEKMTREKELEGGQARRNSNVIPSRYLTGSAGSCHDLCKFGHKHECEVKMKAPVARSVTLRTQSDRKVVLSRTQSERRDVTSRTPSERKDIRSKPQSERKDVLLRSKSERRDVPKVEISAESCNQKSVFRRLSLPAAKESSQRQRGDEIKGVKKSATSHKKLLASSSLKGREIGVVKDEHKPVYPVKSASCKSKPPVKRTLSMDVKNKSSPENSVSIKNETECQQEAKAKEPEDVQERILEVIEPSSENPPIKTIQEATLDKKPLESRVGTIKGSNDSRFTKSMLPTIHRPFGHQDTHIEVMCGINTSISSNMEKLVITPNTEQSTEPKAMSEKPEMGQAREKGSSTWKIKIKKAALAVLSSGNMSPKILKFRKPESTTENRKVDADEHGAEWGKVVLTTMEKKEGKDLSNVVKETAPEPIKSGKNTVKTLVGAFEALISLGDRRSLVAASAS